MLSKPLHTRTCARALMGQKCSLQYEVTLNYKKSYMRFASEYVSEKVTKNLAAQDHANLV
jgi:hypothetical protein